MVKPTPTQINDWSHVDFPSLGYPDDPSLQVLIDRSAALVESITGYTLPALPSAYDPMMQQAIQMATEVLAYQAQPDVIETAADFMLIASFSAGSYSETRRSLTEITQAKGMFTPNPLLNNLLFSLMTPDQRDFWWAWINGQNLPSFAVTEVDWAGGGLRAGPDHATGYLDPGDPYIDVWGD